MNKSSILRVTRYRFLYWLPLLLLSSSDAHAWGLHTHIWFAQNLLWLVPLADARMRQAIARYPRLMLAGACLPDLALVGHLASCKCFDSSHDWERAQLMLVHARSDEERALALGYASHLLSDVFAHNYFVPAHEAVWGDVPFFTHAFCEWSLDHHLADHLFATPRDLLHSEEASIAPWLVREFGCKLIEAQRSLHYLAQGDALLRATRLPAMAYLLGRVCDRKMLRRFNHYLQQTTRRMHQINRLLAGEQPMLGANPARQTAHAAIAGEKLARIQLRLPLPRDVFKPRPAPAAPY